jgi:hypothetical protein
MVQAENCSVFLVGIGLARLKALLTEPSHPFLPGEYIVHFPDAQAVCQIDNPWILQHPPVKRFSAFGIEVQVLRSPGKKYRD